MTSRSANGTSSGGADNDVYMAPAHLTDFVIHLGATRFHCHRLTLHQNSAFFNAHFIQQTASIQSQSAISTKSYDRSSLPDGQIIADEKSDSEGFDFIVLPENFTAAAADFKTFLDNIYYPHVPVFQQLQQQKGAASPDTIVSEADRLNKSTATHLSHYTHKLDVSTSVLYCAVYFKTQALVDRAEAALLTHINHAQVANGSAPNAERKSATQSQVDLAYAYLHLAHRYGLAKLKARCLQIISGAQTNVGERRSQLAEFDKELIIEVMMNLQNNRM